MKLLLKNEKGEIVKCPMQIWAARGFVVIQFLFGVIFYAKADESAYGLCMARANAIRTTAEVRDSGVSEHEYEVRYAKMAGRPLNAAENEVVILAFAAPNYSPTQLYRIAVNGCQQYVR